MIPFHLKKLPMVIADHIGRLYKRLYQHVLRPEDTSANRVPAYTANVSVELWD